MVVNAVVDAVVLSPKFHVQVWPFAGPETPRVTDVPVVAVDGALMMAIGVTVGGVGAGVGGVGVPVFGAAAPATCTVVVSAPIVTVTVVSTAC